jgi:hypothetical protein
MTVTGPSWLAGTFAVIMLVMSAYCVSRLLAARWWHRHTERDVDAVHVLMGVAMAGMLVPRLNPFWDGGWEAVFAIWTAWFAGQMIRAGRRHRSGHGQRPAHHLPHLLSSGAMLYMLLAVTSGAAAGAAQLRPMAGTAGAASRLPALALVLALAILGHVIWTTDRLTSLAPVAGTGPRALPRAQAALAYPASVTAAGAGAGAGAGADVTPAGADVCATGADATISAAPRGAKPPISPRLAACCEIAMGVTMGYMLILMV